MAEIAPNIFPLPLSDFEYYMLSDNSNEYPMTFVLSFHLSGQLSREAWTQAVNEAVRLHPLLSSRVRRNWFGGLRWINNNDPVEILWNEPTGDLPPESLHFDLAHRNGLRVRMEETHPDSWRTTFEFHHSCCDGLGGFIFIGAVFANYGRLTATSPEEIPQLAPIERTQLLTRGKLGTADKSDSCKQARCLKTVAEKLQKMFGRKVNILSEPSGPRSEAQSYPFLTTATLSQSDCNALQRHAKLRQCSINDLYLQQMFSALHDWNQTHGSVDDSEWIRIGVPVSMRTPCHESIPACNLVSYLFLSRQSREVEQPDELLEFIRTRTNQGLNKRLGHWFLKGLKAIRCLPGLLPQLLKRRQRFATAIASNVGDVRRCFGAKFAHDGGKFLVGNLRLEEVSGIPPVRRGTRLSLYYMTYAGKVTITIKADPHLFSAEQCQALLNSYVKHLKRLAGETDQQFVIERAA